MPINFDGNLVDVATIAVGVIAAFVKPTIRLFKRAPPCFVFKDFAADLLNGALAVPFLVLIGAAVSTEILTEAMKSGKVSMALGGLLGLAFVFKELAAYEHKVPPPGQQQSPPTKQRPPKNNGKGQRK